MPVGELDNLSASCSPECQGAATEMQALVRHALMADWRRKTQASLPGIALWQDRRKTALAPARFRAAICWREPFPAVRSNGPVFSVLFPIACTT